VILSLEFESKYFIRTNLIKDRAKGETYMDRREFLRSGMMFSGLIALSGGLFSACANEDLVATESNKNLDASENPIAVEGDELKKVVKTDEEWKRILTKEQYEVARKGGTEKPYSSPLNNIKKKGVYACVCCDLPLFDSKTKFESGTGWPSFYAPINKINVSEKIDNTLAETRTEVLCSRCDAHLGHVFDDGPKPTGLRYCMNGVAMKFVKAV
jgi:peptide-methionine (R)-S-oxide reductase